MRKALLWGLVACVVVGGILFLVTVAGVVAGGGTGLSFGQGVGVIRLEADPILSADETVELIEKARKADHIKAIVLRIDSPGGAVGASQEIHFALQRLAREKPLIASMGNVAASGGYYAAVAAQQIFALPGTITASIGVRMAHVDASGLFQWLQLKPETLKSGALKDAGDVHRPMRPEERAYLEGLLRTMHGQFKRAVAEGRHLELEVIESVADGRVMTGEEALAAKLVDQLGDLQDAIGEAGESAGLSRDPEVYEIEPHHSWWEGLGRSEADGLVKQLTGVGRGLRGPFIGYLWRP